MALVVSRGYNLYVMYVDEAGDLASLADPARANDQPVFILAGLILHSDHIKSLTADFLALKRRFYPKLRHPELKMHLDWILPEIKGSDLRRSAMSASRNERRHAQAFVNELLKLIESRQGKLVGRVWVKKPGDVINSRAIYAYSVQALFASFDNFLSDINSTGVCIADSRTKQLNEPIAHAIFTQIHSLGPTYAHIKEVPLFGHSGNHAGLQASDLIVSGILMPIACYVYCNTFVANVHVNAKAVTLRDKFGVRIKNLQHRYMSGGKFKGGITTADPVNKASAAIIFQ